MTDLVIIIVSHNTKADLLACLASIHAHPPAVAHEVVVVDNASTDGSADGVRTAWPAVRVMAVATNVGFARANNLAIRATASEMVLLLNSDTLVLPGAVDAMVRELVDRPDAAVVGPRLVDEERHTELSFGSMIGPLNELVQKSLGAVHRRRVPLVWRLIERRTLRRQHPDWVSGACLMVRRRDAEAVGLLDERFFMYAEDVDFCAALRQRGRKIVFTPAAEVIHRRGRSAAVAPGATEEAYRHSQIAFYRKHHPEWVPLLRAYLRCRGKLPAGA